MYFPVPQSPQKHIQIKITNYYFYLLSSKHTINIGSAMYMPHAHTFTVVSRLAPHFTTPFGVVWCDIDLCMLRSVSGLKWHHLVQREWKLRPQFSPPSTPHHFCSGQGAWNWCDQCEICGRTTDHRDITRCRKWVNPSCITTFSDAFKFMFRRNSWWVISHQLTKLRLNIRPVLEYFRAFCAVCMAVFMTKHFHACSVHSVWVFCYKSICGIKLRKINCWVLGPYWKKDIFSCN